MIFRETALSGAIVIEPEPLADNRGFFARLYCRETFSKRGLNAHLEQISMSHSNRAGIVRGLHLQRPPHAEAKLVRVTQGSVYDVIVDVRAGSPSYGQWFGIEISASNRKQLYVPEGFAHGFQTLTETVEMAYHISVPFVPEAQDGILWNDPELAISWPHPGRVEISERDAGLKVLSCFEPVTC
jgi:dTDP-4-dehydrorhamnose 3,5-epimerase